MTRTIQLSGARGGQGTTTTAVALAVLCAGHGSTLLCSDDPVATAALVGVPLPLGDEYVEVCPNLTFVPASGGTVKGAEYDTVVVDAGRIPAGPFDRATPDWSLVEADGPVDHFAVLRGPCYVALSSLLAAGGWFDGVILMIEPGRALSERDVTDVLGIPAVATIPIDPAVARTIDAGLLLSRLHRHATPFSSLARLAQPAKRLTTTPMPSDTDLLGPKLGPRTAAPPRRVRRSGRAVCTAWDHIASTRDAEHRATRARGGRLLRR